MRNKRFALSNCRKIKRGDRASQGLLSGLNHSVTIGPAGGMAGGRTTPHQGYAIGQKSPDGATGEPREEPDEEPNGAAEGTPTAAETTKGPGP
jgi:hypothetical protein